MKNFNCAITFIVVLLICVACHNQDRPSLALKSNLDTAIKQMTKKFCLPYPADLKLDSNSMLFYGARTFDTSFVIHIVKGPSEIDGTYYEVLPSYHTNVNSFATTTGSELLFFEGYSFVMDSTKWEMIKNRVKNIQLDDTCSQSKSGYVDGESYGLYYNAIKKIKSNSDDITKYQSFYKFLKDSLLEDFIQRRKPIMHH